MLKEKLFEEKWEITSVELETVKALEKLHYLVREPRDFEPFFSLLEKNGELINTSYGNKNCTLLSRAVQCQNKQAVVHLLDLGADVNQRVNGGTTPLHLACTASNLEIVKLLLDGGANVLAVNKNGDQPVHLASGVGNVAIIKLLKSFGAQLTTRGNRGNTCLHFAASEARIDGVQYLLEEGLSPHELNNLTETPFHLLAGCYKYVSVLTCAKILIDAGANVNARTQWGDTPIHYCALTGTPNMLEFLVKEGVSMLKEGGLSSRSVVLEHGEPEELAETYDLSFLCKVAKSTCIVKTTFIIDGIMNARKQSLINVAIEQMETYGKKEYKEKTMDYRELTRIEEEFLELGEELRKDTSDKNSTFQYFVVNTPDSLNYLFDRCLHQIHPCQLQGKIYLDFFLFDSPDGLETNIYRSLIKGDKQRFFVHPIFQVFLKLKWNMVERSFWLYIVTAATFALVIALFVLQRFSPAFQGYVSQENVFMIMNVVLVVRGIVCTLTFILTTVTFLVAVKNRDFCDFIVSCKEFIVDDVFHHSCPVLLSLLLYVDLSDEMDRAISAVLIIISHYAAINQLAKIPKVGIQSLMMSKVLGNMVSFFISFIPLFIGFGISFHILLPDSEVFSTFGNSVIKVLTMLMGDFEFTNNFAFAKHGIAKIFFLVFLVLMSLVMMNLVLGLAISDISELEKVSKVKRMMAEHATIHMFEKVILYFRKCPGFRNMFRNPSLIRRDNGTTLWVFLEIVDLDRNPRNRLVLGNVDNPEECSTETPIDIFQNTLQILKPRVDNFKDDTSEKLEKEEKCNNFADRISKGLEELTEKQMILENTMLEMKSQLQCVLANRC